MLKTQKAAESIADNSMSTTLGMEFLNDLKGPEQGGQRTGHQREGEKPTRRGW